MVMAEYRMRDTGEILDEQAYRALHPNVSFAPGFVPIDADRIVETPAPAVGRYQRAVRDGITFDDGKWMQAWFVESLPPDELKAARRQASEERWLEIKARRTQCEYGGVQVGSAWFHTDADSRIKYLALKDQARDVLAAGGSAATPLVHLGKQIRWKTLGTVFVPMTAGLACEVVQAVGELDAAAFANAEQHRIAMMMSPDPAEYDFSAGWPATYEEQP